MSLHRNNSRQVTMNAPHPRRFARCAPRAWPALLLIAALGVWSAGSGARADEPTTPAEIEKRINELASRNDPTDAELEELVALGQKYAELMGQSTPPPPADQAGPPTPEPADEAAPAPTPRPTAGRRGMRGQTASPSPSPSPSPAGRPGRRSGRGAKPPAEATPAPAEAAPGEAAPGEEIEVSRNMAAEQYLKSYNEREYQFSIKDGTYAELIENFGRMASLPVIGAAPPGSVTFVSADVMDFKTALGRVQMLLFKHPDQYWLDFKKDKGYLEIVRMVDIKRYIPLNRIYISLAAYQADKLDDNEIAMLLYTPESGSIGELEPL
ncbi:MAG: hypothetical protein IT540_08515, partial [Hyphomicrobium sp.]|nr:hypothetical protein [Hyphomicrobium sp.]